ncbi:MAG: hypothetical protein HUU57_03495 [Bdellovibrio sp.]|nr:hypothetical protein [Bdellovibrio sp.]
MRIIDTKNTELVDAKSDSYASSVAANSVVTQTSYHELSDKPVVQSDALMQLHANIDMLNDLQGRLSFLMREVRYLLKA